MEDWNTLPWETHTHYDWRTHWLESCPRHWRHHPSPGRSHPHRSVLCQAQPDFAELLHWYWDSYVLWQLQPLLTSASIETKETWLDLGLKWVIDQSTEIEVRSENRFSSLMLKVNLLVFWPTAYYRVCKVTTLTSPNPLLPNPAILPAWLTDTSCGWNRNCLFRLDFSMMSMSVTTISPPSPAAKPIIAKFFKSSQPIAPAPT